MKTIAAFIVSHTIIIVSVISVFSFHSCAINSEHISNPIIPMIFPNILDTPKLCEYAIDEIETLENGVRIDNARLVKTFN